jgi:hypothetical protein
MKTYIKDFECRREAFHKPASVMIVAVDHPPAIALAGDVIKGVGVRYPYWTRHNLFFSNTIIFQMPKARFVRNFPMIDPGSFGIGPSYYFNGAR